MRGSYVGEVITGTQPEPGWLYMNTISNFHYPVDGHNGAETELTMEVYRNKLAINDFYYDQNNNSKVLSYSDIVAVYDAYVTATIADKSKTELVFDDNRVQTSTFKTIDKGFRSNFGHLFRTLK